MSNALPPLGPLTNPPNPAPQPAPNPAQQPPVPVPPAQLPTPAPAPANQSSAAQSGFFSTASTMSRSPLGFLGLCLVLVYAVAGIAFAANPSLESHLKAVLVWFIVLYPVLVLVMFVFLFANYRGDLIWPSDFPNPGDYIKYMQQRDEEMRRTVNGTLALAQKNAEDVHVVAAANPTPVGLRPGFQPVSTMAIGAAAADANDPQKGRWGGQRTKNGYELRAGPVTLIPGSPNYYRIPLEVVRTNGQAIPGPVKFYLHPTFTPDVRVVAPTGASAKLDLVGYGAFTAGALLPDGTQLELDLAGADIDAPAPFKAA